MQFIVSESMILLRWKDNFSKAGFVDFLGFVEAMSAYQSAGDRLSEANDSVTWFHFSSLCKKDFSIFLFFDVQGELRNSNGVKTKMLKALQMSWPNHSMFGSTNFGNCLTVAVMACLSAYLYVAQQTWHISQHLATSCSCWQQASVLACLVQVKIKKEDFYAASQAESNSLWCLYRLIFALRSMKSSDISLKCHQNTLGPLRVWGFHSTRSSWLHTVNISVKFPLHSIPKLR